MDTAWLILAGGAAFAAAGALAAFAPRLLRNSSPVGVLVVALAGATLGVLAPGAPTRLEVLDAVMRAVLGAAFVLAAATTPPRWRLAAAVMVAIPPFFAPGGGIAALLALGVALATVLLGIDGAVLGALIGLGIGQAALRLGWPHTTGLTALVALVALLALALPALALLPTRSRRRLLVPAAVVGGIAVLVMVVYAGVVLIARTDVNQGVDSANAGLAAAKRGDTVLAAHLFEQSRAAFADAQDSLGSWFAKPVLAVPIAAQQARALSRMSEIGVALATAGANTSRAADPNATKLADGTVPLEKIAALEPPLTDARASLRSAGRRLRAIDATWLVAPLDDKLTELQAKVAQGAHDADTAVLAAKVVPALLGANGSKRYFVAFQTPAEQRASGGIIGNYALIDFTDGHLTKLRSGRDGDLNTEGQSVRTLSGPADYVKQYAQFTPQYTWQNVTMSPDWPSVAQVIENIYPQSGGEPVDGVIGVDPVALAAFLKLTGPVRVEGLDEPLTAKNAARILLHDQYLLFDNQGERVDFLGNAMDAVFDRLQHGNLPGAARMGEVLGPMVKQGRIKLYTSDPAGEAFVHRIHAAGELPPVRGDFAGLVTQNAAGNKIDIFLHRSLRYEATIDPDGTVHAVATITLRNDAPTSGYPDYVISGSGTDPTPPGHYRGILTLYTPLALQGATLNGATAQLTTTKELDRNALTTFVDLDSGGSATMRLELEGRVRMPPTGSAGDAARRYRLTVWHQATIQPEGLEVVLRPGQGAALGDPKGVEEVGDAFVLRTDDQRTDGQLAVTVSDG